MTSILVANILDTDTRPAGWWTDGQGHLDMRGDTLAEAKAELLAQCTSDDQRAQVLAGSIEVAS